jgi:predicted MFS family arabinose efflux permease
MASMPAFPLHARDGERSPGPVAEQAQAAARRLGMAGVLAVGVSFGFARYGYGLFLPDLRADFGLSVAAIGLIGSATYAGYLVALLLVGSLAPRFGPRALVATGGLAATVGMALVGVAGNRGVLIAGLILAGTSPGWVWAPYSDAAARMLPPGRRERVLAAIPSGTAFGVAVAGPLALLSHGTNWQDAWLVFAAGALVATAYNLRVLPAGRHPVSSTDAARSMAHRWLLRRLAVPLYLTALSYGVIGSVYWLFAVEAIVQASGSGDRTAPLFWTLIGVSGTAAIWAGAVFARLGLARSHLLLFTCMAVATALLGMAPGSLAANAASALLYGPCFMAGSALLAVWSYQVFPEWPTTGLSATVFFLGLGTIAGPIASGILADHHGLGWTFLLTAALALTTNALAPAPKAT